MEPVDTMIKDLYILEPSVFKDDRGYFYENYNGAESSPAFGSHVSVERSSENKREFMIPRGFLHGFSLQIRESLLACKGDNLCPKASEFSVRYGDPDIGVDWHLPTVDVVISEKYHTAGTFIRLRRSWLLT